MSSDQVQTKAEAEIIGEIQRGRAEVVRVAKRTFKGRELIDVFVWLRPTVSGGQYQVTRAGLTLRAENWRELLPVIERAIGADNDGSGM